jgi:hypothetical protein
MVQANKTLRFVRITKTILVMLFFATSAFGEERTDLPFDLNYFMSQRAVSAHLRAIDAYRVESQNKDTIAYMIPAPDSNTTNGLFLRFNDDKLIEIDSTKFGMNSELYTHSE